MRFTIAKNNVVTCYIFGLAIDYPRFATSVINFTTDLGLCACWDAFIQLTSPLAFRRVLSEYIYSNFPVDLAVLW